MKADHFFPLVLIISVLSCTNSENKNCQNSTPTSGNLILGIDESLRPFADAEIRSFINLYRGANITPLYLPEKEVIDKLITNEIQTGIICRELYFDEMKVIQDTFAHFPRTVKLATDAIVLAVNNTNKIDNISYNEFEKILLGEITDWGQLQTGIKEKRPIIVITTRASSVNRYVCYLTDTVVQINSYALDSTSQVINYICKNPDALGILGGSWFYQKGDEYYDIKIVSHLKTSIEGNIKSTLYRGIFAVTHEPINGLGNGFIAFMASEKGQLIISKAGMVPYREISRDIKLSK